MAGQAASWYRDVLLAVRDAIDIPPAAGPGDDELRCALLAWRCEAVVAALTDVIDGRHIPLEAIDQLAGALAGWQPADHYRAQA